VKLDIWATSLLNTMFGGSVRSDHAIVSDIGCGAATGSVATLAVHQLYLKGTRFNILITGLL
jgi:hypothetical protein